MSSKPHRQRKQKRSHSKTEQFENDEENGDDVSAELDRLIVRNNDTSYSPRAINISGKTRSEQRETFANGRQESQQGNLFRNCALAINGQESVEPVKVILHPNEQFQPTQQETERNNPFEEQTNNQQNHQQFSQQSIREFSQQESFTPRETYNNIPQNVNTNQQTEQRTPEQQESDNDRYNDFVNMNIMNGDIINGDVMNEFNNNAPGVVYMTPNQTRKRPFNKKAFRIIYIIIIILLVLSFAALIFINKIIKHKEKLQKENKLSDNTPRTQTGGQPIEYTPQSPHANEHINEQMNEYENDNIIDTSFIPAVSGGYHDENDFEFNDEMIEDNYEQQPQTAPSTIQSTPPQATPSTVPSSFSQQQQIPQGRPRDNKGRFMKAVDSVL